MSRNAIGSTPRFSPWTVIIQLWHIWFVFYYRGLWYANDYTTYLSGKIVEEVLNSLENVSPNLLWWLTEKELKGNASKCHSLISSSENVHVNIGSSQIKNSSSERLLGIDIKTILTKYTPK